VTGTHPPTPDEVNRIWQHGLHEERLFHDRMNYFSALEVGLLSVCGILYNKEPALGVLLPLAIVAFCFTLLWLLIQARHWRYCLHVNTRIRELVPEYRRTVDAFEKGASGLSLTKPLALSVPVLFALSWLAFAGWLVTR
jgi:hypothetical protein